MNVIKMKAEPRTALGRNQVAQIRKEGWLPAIVYGDGKEPQPISVSEWELDQHVRQHHKVFHLDIAGQRQDAYLQEVRWDAITDRPVHVDFKRIDINKPIELEVEVSLLGYAVGLGKGGVMIKDHQTVRVRCLPLAIPESIEAKIAHLDVDQALLAKELVLPEGVTLASPPDMVVCHVAKLVVAAAPAAAAPAAEAPAEGAAPAAPADKPAKG